LEIRTLIPDCGGFVVFLIPVCSDGMLFLITKGIATPQWFQQGPAPLIHSEFAASRVAA